ncbi:MAG: heavy metal translocating P-type ATPase [Pseudomonadota bacterium]
MAADGARVDGTPTAPADPAPPTVADFMVPDIHCAGCMRRIEEFLSNHPGILRARVNLTQRRVRIEYQAGQVSTDDLVARLSALGYPARPVDTKALAAIGHDRAGRDLLARLGVAGFAAMNVMLLSVSVWSGAEGATRDLMHWVSGLIALPAIAYAGVPFFRSAKAALTAGRLNMDVPISLAVILAAGTSLYETAQSGAHAYFDAGISLVFFLLIGRYLDHRSRALARSAAAELASLSARSASLLTADGTRKAVPVETLAIGDVIEVAAGERLPADGTVRDGRSDLDRSLLTGETVPEPTGPGGDVLAGMLNLSGPLTVTVTATVEDTFLADIARMIAAAEQGRGRYDRWADQAARIYAPGVHLIALAAFIGWAWATGDWHLALTTATAVLIITCPCALGLAVPAVHAVASGRLFRKGIFLKDGSVLERLARIDTVVFDKTGTLTDGQPVLVEGPEDPRAWALALALAEGSRHPLSQALAAAIRARGIAAVEVAGRREHPGQGISGSFRGVEVRLGHPDWIDAPDRGEACVCLLGPDGAISRFSFEDRPREDLSETCAALRGMGLTLAVFSGDAEAPVRRIADLARIDEARARMTPGQKMRALEALSRQGRRVLMVGDGINDAPSLAAADASMSPVAAADVSRAAAGLVFTGARLAPVAEAIATARSSRKRAMENFALAALYNAVAIPAALAGLITPLVAALAMSGSSIVVTLNALRVRFTS